MPFSNLVLESRRIIGVVALLAAAGAALAAPVNRPNILFLFTDDQASWTLGCYGNHQAHTPNLDRLAAGGVRLTNALVATPVCSPARASFFTSRYGSEVGILDFITNPDHKEYTDETGAVGLDARFTTFPALLKQAGYATALVGKWHVGDWTKDPTRRFHPTRHGFEYFMGLTGGGCPTKDPTLEKDGRERQFTGLTEDILTSDAIAYLEKRDTARPFFLFLGFRAPHTQYLPVAPEDAAHYRDLDPEIPNPNYPDLNVPEVKKRMREYLSSVTCVDRNVGRLLAALDQLKLAENTIVVFSSDHGYNMGHNGIWHKGNGIWITNKAPVPQPNITGRYRPNLYDHSLRVPALVRWPAMIKPGTTIDATVSSLDWFPTILAMAGASVPSNLTIRGRNALPLLRGEKVSWDNDFFSEYSMRVYCRTDMRSYRTADWKLVRDFLNPSRDELYHLKTDPAESRNRIRDTDNPMVSAAIKELDDKIKTQLRKTGDPVLPRGGATAP
jgi:arylsulfatase A-like enzyme